jgi:hypothetical protein
MNIEYYKTCLTSIYRKAGSRGDYAYYESLMLELITLTDSWHNADAGLDDDEYSCLIDSTNSLVRYLNKQRHNH